MSLGEAPIRSAALAPRDGSATAWAGTNIALVKYWGKRPGPLNLPAAGSLSLTLADLGTRTSVQFRQGAGIDTVVLNGQPADAAFAARTSQFLNLIRAQAGLVGSAHVQTENTIPTAAGLASSASGFAALALAASEAAGLQLTPTELSRLARQGSGSAARSIFGGFVQMHAGVLDSGADAFAQQLLPPSAWDLRLVVALTAKGAKALGSTEAMRQTAATSPFYPAWVASVPNDLNEAQAAIARRDLEHLGRITERSCLRMHACALASDPGILYWNPVTLAAMQTVRELRAQGTAVFFTIDAGPHVKALCRAADAPAVQQALAQVPGVLQTLAAQPGPGASLLNAGEQP